jgi:IclR family pca regulon transcriptional regulator
MSSTENESFVRAFSRGLDVIEALGNGLHSKSISMVADETGLSRAAARRLLMTLAERQFVTTDGKTFSLSPRVLNLGLTYLHTLPFWPYAQPALEDLRAQTQESCGMAVLDGTEIVYVLRVPSRRILAMNANIGTRLPAHNVSLGQVLLSELEAEALKGYCAEADFTPRTSRSLTSPRSLKPALEQIRSKGYAWVDGELDTAICGVAVPLRDRAGKIIAAINISLIAGEWNEAKARKHLLAPLRQAAEQIRSAMRA